MVSAQLYQSSFHDESCSGCQIRNLIGWVIVEQFILDSLRLLIQIQRGFQLLLSNGTSAAHWGKTLVGLMLVAKHPKKSLNLNQLECY